MPKPAPIEKEIIRDYNYFQTYVSRLRDRYGLLPLEEELYHGMLMSEGGNEQSREILVKHNLLHASNLALEYFSNHRPPISLLDLLSEANIGLRDAVPRFDYREGRKVIVFARKRIRGSMIDFVREEFRQQGITRQDIKHWNRINKFLREQNMPHNPDWEKVSSGTGLSMKDIKRARLVSSYQNVSIDRIWGIPDDCPGPMGRLELMQSSELVDRILSDGLVGLSENEQSVLCKYYIEEKTMSVIGREMGYTESWVSKLHSSGIKRIKEWLARNPDESELLLEAYHSGEFRGPASPQHI